MSNDKSKAATDKFAELINRRVKHKTDRPDTIGFDELGNAQFQWHDSELMEESVEADLRRHKALSVANLVLVDDEPAQNQTFVPLNKHGLRLGYNPYDSGRLEKTATNKRVDLRELSKWIEARRSQQGSDQ